ncbi:MAG: helix-turn-helix transcriptional regulator [Bacilli bacterium]|nr:helix-turn-helix transcriptional regulator [Bacilli bacterium]
MKGNCDYMMGQRIKEARKKLGITQVELAHQIGVEPAEISQYETDKRTPRWDKFNKLLDVLGVTADYMLGREVTAVSDDEEYKIKLSKSDLHLLNIIKSYPKFYKKISNEPERKIKYLDSNINSILPE